MNQIQNVGIGANLLSYHLIWIEHYDEVFDRIYWKNYFTGEEVEVQN